MASTYPACPLPRATGGPKSWISLSHPRPIGYLEGGHQLEKLEFALAVAITRGEVVRADELRSQIAALGGNAEEPGT